MLQLLNVHSMKILLICALSLMLNLNLTFAEPEDVARQQEILEAISQGVAHYSDDNFANTDQGLLSNYDISSFMDRPPSANANFDGSGGNNRRNQSLYAKPACCQADLYYHIFNELNFKLNETVMEFTLQSANISEAEFLSYTPGSDQSRQEQTSADYVNKRRQYTQIYDDKKSLVGTTRKQALKSIAFEIFANNSTWDSSFDLLEDLEDIESLLFGENIPWDFFDLPEDSRSPGQQIVDLNPDLSELEDDIAQEDLQEQRFEETLSELQVPDPASEELQDIDPNQCGIGDELLDQLNPPDPSLEQAPVLSTSQLPLEQEDHRRDPSSLGLSNPDPLGDIAAGFVADFQCYDGSDVIYSIVGQPKQRYCFYVREVREAIGLETPNSRCTLCSVNRIQKEYAKTVEKPLVTRKVVGHYLEPPFCKNQILDKLKSVDILFVAKPLFPLDSPYKELAKILPARSAQKVADQQREKATLPEIYDSGTPYAEIIEDLQKQTQEQSKRKIQSSIAIATDNLNKTQVGVMAQLAQRMELFNSNLDSLNDTLESMRDLSKAIQSKPKCQ